jgi:hypothetical protein
MPHAVADPFPLTEAVAIFENVTNTAMEVWAPQTSYYRPLFYLTVSTIWHNRDRSTHGWHG